MRQLIELLTDQIPFVHEHSMFIGVFGFLILFTVLLLPVVWSFIRML